jgi:uncharacterized protein (TIGR00255 family)
MLRSMTAFARRESQNEWGAMTWELRSFNHRYLEISPRLPEVFRALEPVIREQIGKYLSRGKIECNLRYQPGPEAAHTLSLNRPLAGRLLEIANELEQMMGQGTGLRTVDILRWPNVVSEPEPDLEPVKKVLLNTLDEALSELVATREREGERISAMIRQRCDAMTGHVQQVRLRRPEVVSRLREKLLARLNELPQDADPGRLEQEMVIVAQRLDVAEELDRLDAHLTEIQQVLQRKEPVGRRLDFLMQELNREANTLASKSSDAATTRASVDLKVLIEQMREQIQNIE